MGKILMRNAGKQEREWDGREKAQKAQNEGGKQTELTELTELKRGEMKWSQRSEEF